MFISARVVTVSLLYFKTYLVLIFFKFCYHIDNESFKYMLKSTKTMHLGNILGKIKLMNSEFLLHFFKGLQFFGRPKMSHFL